MSDFDTICKIVDRAEALYLETCNRMPSSRQGLIMDIDYTNQIIPLDLDRFLAADNSNFAHDIGGILRHFNRTTKKMDDFFTPRFATNQAAAAIPIHIRAIDWAIKQGFVLSVQDYSCEPDEWDLVRSQDRNAVIEACIATELPNVTILTADGSKRIAVFSVIDEGIPDETINDYSAIQGGIFDTFMEGQIVEANQ